MLNNFGPSHWRINLYFASGFRRSKSRGTAAELSLREKESAVPITGCADHRLCRSQEFRRSLASYNGT